MSVVRKSKIWWMIARNFVFKRENWAYLTVLWLHHVIWGNSRFPDLRCIDDWRFQFLHLSRLLEFLCKISKTKWAGLIKIFVDVASIWINASIFSHVIYFLSLLLLRPFVLVRKMIQYDKNMPWIENMKSHAIRKTFFSGAQAFSALNTRMNFLTSEFSSSRQWRQSRKMCLKVLN